MSAKTINSISFQNFYNYYGGYENNFYEFNEGLNIIVADNGAGKSKFFNGMLWILKNLVYDSELKREFRVEQVLYKIISDKAKIETDIDQRVRVGVKLLYQDDKNEYIIEKYFYSQRIKEGKALDQKCWEFDDIKQEVSKRDLYLKTFHPIYDIAEQKRIIDNIILPGLQPYALLQGEEIDNIIDFSTESSLNEAINKLTNINKVKELVQLTQYLCGRSAKDLDNQRKLHTKNKTAIEAKIAEKDKLIHSLEENESLQKATVETYNKAKEERESITNSITNAEKRGEFRTKINELEKRKERILEEQKVFYDKINTYFFDPDYSWLLLGLDSEMRAFSNIKDDYIEARTKKKIKSERTSDVFFTLLPDQSPDYISLEKMLEKELCFVCGRNAPTNSPEWLYIKKVKDRPKRDPEGNDYKPNNDLKEFFDTIQMNAQQYYKKIVGIRDSVKNTRLQILSYETQIRDISKDIEDTNQELIQFGGNKEKTSESKDKNVVEIFTKATDRIGSCTTKLEKLESEIASMRSQILSLNREIEDLSDTDLPPEYQLTTDMLYDIEESVRNTKNRIFSDILNRLEKNSNKHFQRLTVGNNVDGGILKLTKSSDETAIIEVVDNNGNPITGSSEGFQRMKKLAIVMAIISSRDEPQTFDYPLIADAPLSAFGKGFIEGFFSEVPHVFNQSIILVKELYDKDRDNKISESAERILNNKEVSTFYLNNIEYTKHPELALNYLIFRRRVNPSNYYLNI